MGGDSAKEQTSEGTAECTGGTGGVLSWQPVVSADSGAAASGHCPAGDLCAIHICLGDPHHYKPLPGSDDGTSVARVPDHGTELGAADYSLFSAAAASAHPCADYAGATPDHAGTGAAIANHGAHHHVQCDRPSGRTDCWYGRCGWVSSSTTDLADMQP